MFCEYAKPRGADCENSECRRGIICSHKYLGLSKQTTLLASGHSVLRASGSMRRERRSMIFIEIKIYESVPRQSFCDGKNFSRRRDSRRGARKYS